MASESEILAVIPLNDAPPSPEDESKANSPQVPDGQGLYFHEDKEVKKAGDRNIDENLSGGNQGEFDYRHSSAYVYGSKPFWGWDYAFAFKADLQTDEGDDTGSCESPKQKRTEKKSSDEENENEDAQSLPESSKVRIEILCRLKSAGFVFSQLYSPSEGMILVRFTLPARQMKKKAELLKMELKLKQKYGGGFLEFRTKYEDCFENSDLEFETGAFFCPSDRVLIILRTLQSKEHWGCDLNIERLVYKQQMVQAYAIHSLDDKARLLRDAVWARWWDPSWTPPFGRLKEYLGARVGLYFAFVSFYARRLLGIAVLSIPVFITMHAVRSAKIKAILLWAFGICLALWTTYFLESWKRRNAMLALDWGLNDYHEDNTDDIRPQFKGDLRYGFYCKSGFVPLADLVPGQLSHDVSKSQHGREHIEGDADNAEMGFNVHGHVSVEGLPQNPYQDPRKSRVATFQSVGITLCFVATVTTLTFLLVFFRNDIICGIQGFNKTDCKAYFTSPKGREALQTGISWFADALPGILNGILIFAFDALWRTVSLILTRRENHRTNQKFENSLVYKRFAFQFISNYFSLFHIAFLKKLPKLGPCAIVDNGPAGNQKPDCMYELRAQMISLVLTKATIQQLAEIGVPFLRSQFSRWRARRKANKHVEDMQDNLDIQHNPEQADECRIEITKRYQETSACSRYFQEAKLPPYHSTIEDYAEVVIQFGYLALFGLAFPLATCVNLINNLIEVRTDAYKILGVSQRINADDAADIGAWYNILEFLNFLAVLVNAGLLIFTVDIGNTLFSNGKELSIFLKVVIFFLFVNPVLLTKWLVSYFINDVPGRMHQIIARQKYDIARFFNEGWENAFRGKSLLQVGEDQIQLCNKYADLFDQASDDENN